MKESESFSPDHATTGSDSPVPGTTIPGENDSLSFTPFTEEGENKKKEETQAPFDDGKPLTDPFEGDDADDERTPQHLTPNAQHPILTFSIVTLAGEREIEACIAYRDGHTLGIGPNREEALADLRHNVTVQPDDENLRREKLAIIEQVMRGP